MRDHELINELARLWDSVVGTTTPTKRQFSSWIFLFPKEVIVQAIETTGAKVARMAARGVVYDEERIGRYATGTMRHIAEDLELQDAEVSNGR